MTPTTEAAPGPAADGEPFGLRWAVKSSFVAYVAGTADGRAYISGGVVPLEHEVLLFPRDAEGPADPVAGADRVYAFRGDVRFVAHFGMLSVRIAQPRVVLRGGAGELTVADPAAPGGGRVRLVTFTAGAVAQDGLERWDAAAVRLAPEGVALFGDVYRAGEQFAPLTITAPLPAAVPPGT